VNGFVRAQGLAPLLSLELGEAGLAGAGAVGGLDVGVDAGGHAHLDVHVGGADADVRGAEVARAEAVAGPATAKQRAHTLLRDDELRLALAHHREGGAANEALMLEHAA